jgi:hypothetical protein
VLAVGWQSGIVTLVDPLKKQGKIEAFQKILQ